MNRQQKHRPVAFTIQVRQRHVLASSHARPLNCPLKIAAREAGLECESPNYTHIRITNRVTGAVHHCRLSAEAEAWLRNYDRHGPVPEADFRFRTAPRGSGPDMLVECLTEETRESRV